ncbi:MAG: RNA polymerase factor sigma-54 [Planctomycetes bacterium]|nr:RNA polymerase factor sigma-54 [Planctomycetota bacterium]
MKLGLTQHLRAEQRLVQSPQMIQAMQILQCPMTELQDQIEHELQENVFLEVKEPSAEPSEDGPPGGPDSDGNDAPGLDEKLEAQFSAELDQLEQRVDTGPRTAKGSAEESDRRYEMLYNTPDAEQSLSDHLLEQARMADLSAELFAVVEHVVYSLDSDGRLAESAEEIANDLLVPIPLVEEAVSVVRSFEPVGMGARNVTDCLLMQLDNLGFARPLTRRIVEHHLDDLALNKLPKIAKETGASIDDIKECWEFLREHLNPHPGAAFQRTDVGVVTPDVVVEEVAGKFEVRALRGSIPELAISTQYRSLLKQARSDPRLYEFLRRKIEAAKWFIEAVHQRQSTIQRIADEIVQRQTGFLRHGVQRLEPMKMQDVADAVGVHISTVSRAISGKYIQTPQGIMEMKRFFSGGTRTDDGHMISQRAIKEKVRDIVDREDKSQPLSDDQLVEELGKQGIKIARRTVTKYRKSLGIESSTRRREY